MPRGREGGSAQLALAPLRSTSWPGFSRRNYAEMADLVDFAFDSQAIQSFEPQAGEELDTGFERLIRNTKGAVLLGLRALDSRRIRHAPMGGHRIAGPDRADLTGGLVANGEDEIHLGRARLGEFVPTFA